jgi:MoaA/NifB/PqqE/SkfB family radical SAM enzyme
MSMVDLGWKMLRHWASRRWGWPRTLPMNLTLSLTYRCNARCATCNVWKRQADELSLAEWDRVTRSLGRAPYWITVSGGEPLLRADAVAILETICANCRPAILNIPTNGLLPERIARSVSTVTECCPDTQLVVNLSLDGWGADHDRIRGVPGGFARAVETYRRLRALEAPNLTLGVHTVISRFNAESVPDLYRRVHDELAPDSYISEIAEEREELDTMGAGITPTPAAYDRAIEGLVDLQSRHAASGLGRVTWAFRHRYYQLVQRWLRERRQVIPCYAGWASAQIAPDGDVWFCCVRAETVGNLRQVDYDFARIWWSEKAQRMREAVRAGRCDCPLANAAYTNLLLHPPSVAGVAWDLVRRNGRP